MKRVTLSDVLKARNRSKILTLLACLILVFFIAQLVIVKNPKTIKAGVTESGNSLTIAGDRYVVDADGNLFGPSALLTDENGNNIDFRYYSYYIKNYPTGFNVKNRDLILRDTTVAMEGNQSLNSLSIESGGKITQPMADREGKINRPLYSGDYWGAKFVGFLAIPKDKGIWLTVDDADVDDAVMVEVCKKTGSQDPGTNIAECNSDSGSAWSMVYKRSNGVTDWGSGGYDGVSDVSAFRSGWGDIFSNYGGGSDKYVPVRFSFGDMAGDAKIKFRARIYTTTAMAWTGPDSNGPLWNGYLYSYSTTTGLIDNDNIAADRGHMYFEYYLFNTNSLYADFSHSIKTAYKPYLYLDSDFGGGYGDIDSGGTDRFNFIFQNGLAGNQATSPVGNSIATAKRFISSRYSAKGLNANAFDWPVRSDAGLTLNIAGELKVSANYGIDLNGVGYPGWAKEFNVIDSEDDVGAGPGGGSSVDRDNTGESGTGGGGWHAGRGGTYKLGSGNDADNRITIAAPTIYGDGSDYLNAYSIGSGGGASLWDNFLMSNYATVGGSGGGAVKILANKVTIEAGNAIAANGDSGFGVGSNPTPAGSGGSGGKVVISATVFNTNPGSLTNLTSANGGSKAGFSSPQRFSGGGGGFVNIAYSTTNNDFLTNNQPFDVLKADGGAGEGICEYNPANNPYNLSCSGDRGSISAVQRDSAGAAIVTTTSIKKQLSAITVKSGNPYVLQVGDRIRVGLRITNLVNGQRVAINDEILKVPGSNYQCGENIFYSWEGTEGTGNQEGIQFYPDGSPPYIQWAFIPGSDPVYVYYDCTVR